LVFTKTRLLSVKVATLATFLSMVKVLDQINLTQKLCPLLSKIRTKEPAVIMATLSVQEAMGFKIEREAVATLVLPQLWAMSMGPLLNIEQFQRFMTVIRKLGDRVEKEHNQFLRDSQRIEDQSALANGVNPPNLNSGVDFESLIGRANATTRAEVLDDHRPSWDDDVWGPILNGGHEKPAFSTSTPLGAIPPISPPLRVSSPPSHPQHRTSLPNASSTVPKPNYNVSLSDVILPALNTPSTPPPINLAPNYSPFMITNSPPVTTPPSMGSMLTPMQPTKLVAPSKPVTNDDWGDFDPLK
ncbi:hypothetical protein EDD16DRAFT_1481889, partial [Pisolithus croceorrhizus]